MTFLSSTDTAQSLVCVTWWRRFSPCHLLASVNCGENYFHNLIHLTSLRYSSLNDRTSWQHVLCINSTCLCSVISFQKQKPASWFTARKVTNECHGKHRAAFGPLDSILVFLISHISRELKHFRTLEMSKFQILEFF